MPNILTQIEFDAAAAAWATFIGKAAAADVQALFQTGAAAARQYQTFVSFDLATTIPLLLSTAGIAQVAARFVLAAPAPGEVTPAIPRFRVVLYATDQLGGRISAYYLGDSDFHPIPPKPTPQPQPAPAHHGGYDDTEAAQGLVPFTLISNWLTAWGTAATAQHLTPAMFMTSSYGPLQGYVFDLDDFMDQLFLAPGYSQTQLYLNFGLKTYFPAYPENLKEPAQTFGLVVRLYTPGTKGTGGVGGTGGMGGTGGTGGASGTESGPSYDMAQAFPPG